AGRGNPASVLLTGAGTRLAGNAENNPRVSDRDITPVGSSLDNLAKHELALRLPTEVIVRSTRGDVFHLPLLLSRTDLLQCRMSAEDPAGTTAAGQSTVSAELGSAP